MSVYYYFKGRTLGGVCGTPLAFQNWLKFASKKCFCDYIFGSPTFDMPKVVAKKPGTLINNFVFAKLRT